MFCAVIRGIFLLFLCYVLLAFVGFIMIYVLSYNIIRLFGIYHTTVEKRDQKREKMQTR